MEKKFHSEKVLGHGHLFPATFPSGSIEQGTQQRNPIPPPQVKRRINKPKKMTWKRVRTTHETVGTASKKGNTNS
jgi:hypothetical protein